MSPFRRTIALFAPLVILASHGRADTLTYLFDGSVTNNTLPTGPWAGVSVGSPVHIEYTFDTAALAYDWQQNSWIMGGPGSITIGSFQTSFAPTHAGHSFIRGLYENNGTTDSGADSWFVYDLYGAGSDLDIGGELRIACYFNYRFVEGAPPTLTYERPNLQAPGHGGFGSCTGDGDPSHGGIGFLLPSFRVIPTPGSAIPAAALLLLARRSREPA